jgi:hypothetical protein
VPWVWRGKGGRVMELAGGWGEAGSWKLAVDYVRSLWAGGWQSRSGGGILCAACRLEGLL